MNTMIEKACNVWLEPADYRCIPSTGAVTPDGEAIMDTGIALEAVQRFHNIQLDFGRLLASRGNHVHVLRPGLLSFPVKQYAWAGLSLPTIKRSVSELVALVGNAKTLLPRPVCGDGDPPWDEIAAVLSALPDNVIVVQHG